MYTSTTINIKGYQSFPVSQSADIFISVKQDSYETVMVSQGDDAYFVTVRLNNNGQGISQADTSI